MAKLWGGRFEKDLTESTEDYLQSIEVDKEMVLEDIWGSQAHAIMLSKQDIISNKDLKEILHWLEKAKKDYLSGKLVLSKQDEDVHMNVEKYLIRGAGPEYGGKLHTARSRNDQVLTDAKLHIRHKILDIKKKILSLQNVFIELAEENLETPVPGYTHTQDAQPITLAYWATAYVSAFMRDLKRLDHAYANVDTNPLGSCALAGTSFPIDRRMTAKLLGFTEVHKHSLDVISSRDFIAETLCALTIHMSNLSKLAEEMVYWSTYEFGILELDDSYTAGSSIMPQKKNPCVAELTRGRTGRVYGALMQLLTMMKGIPMGYNRDLQEDKPPLWNAFDIVGKTLDVTIGMIDTMKVNEERLAELSGANFTTATELANHLVREHGLSFRECHHIVGSLVGELHRKGKNFMDFDEVDKILSGQGVKVSFDEMRNIFDPRKNIHTYKSLGSTSPREVSKMIREFKKQMDSNIRRIKSQEERIESAQKLTESIVSKVLEGKDIGGIKIK
ncbi:MAG: argininosuccinate lyase [Candidatus Altiarchaeales archaeon]|nr:argininosuccinate lyase [Candidatus Altiarchaeales archaeon]MBD3417032.1 argininosuccinate lyase [Candidatus Altiarchaeales archaeon]